MIDLISILVLGGIGLYLSARNDVLQQENDRLRDTIKRNNDWFKIDKKVSIDLALINQEFKINSEQFRKQCEEFQERCKEV